MTESQNIINLRACSSIKELALTAHETIGQLENALYQILEVKRLDEAKELAANALGEDLEVYLEDEVPELDFENDTPPWDGDSMPSNFEDTE